MKRWGIRARVLFLALAPSALILTALAGYFTYARIAEVDVLLAQRGISLARQLAPGAEYALFAGDRAALQRMTDAAAHESDVAMVAIADERGAELAASRSIAADSSDVLRFTQPVLQTRLASPDFPEQLHASGSPAKVGDITVAMSRATAHAEQRRLLLTSFGLGLACVMAAVGLAIFVGNSVIRPIQRLARAMGDLSAGRYDVPLDTGGGGELRALNDGFNAMAARLRAATLELQGRIDAATRELTAQKEMAEQATQAKSRFIAAASHDLRQPLHAIELFTATLQRRAARTELEAVVRDLAKAVSVMERLFESLLDISKLDAGTLHAELRPFRLEHLFAQLRAEHAESAEQRGLRFVARSTAAIVLTDELLLHRLLGNLVSNALRYTNEGTVLVACRRQGNEVRIEVRDSGIGIAADRLADVFEEFYQVGNVARDRGQGLGLGLAIVARLARLLRTRVEVRSAPGRGSVFSVRVPRGELVEPLPSVLDAEIAATGGAAPVSVLVIDDDPLVLAGNRALLSELGCDVTTVSNPVDAQSALARAGSAPVLVLCDLWLSDDVNGIDVLRRLTTMTSRPISGILVSGDIRPETIRAARQAGYPLLHKPVSAAKLRAVIASFASRGADNRRTSA